MLFMRNFEKYIYLGLFAASFFCIVISHPCLSIGSFWSPKGVAGGGDQSLGAMSPKQSSFLLTPSLRKNVIEKKFLSPVRHPEENIQLTFFV